MPYATVTRGSVNARLTADDLWHGILLDYHPAVTARQASDSELEQQQAAIEADFREGWIPRGVGEPRLLTERDYTEARKIIEQGGWTGLDRVTIQAVRDGAQPGESLPALRPVPFIKCVTNAQVIITGIGPHQRVAVLFSHEDFLSARFGHRFPRPSDEGGQFASVWLMEEIETGALHRMMRNPPPADSAGIIWTTWGQPSRS